MTAPTAIIAEDEAPQRAGLAVMLAELWPDLHIVATCGDGREAIEALTRHRPDIAFLDIRMPGADGFEVARAAAAAMHVVFITAYDSFAVQAFEDGAADYLLKPVKRNRLQAAIARVKARLASGAPSDLPDLLQRLEAKLAAKPETIRWITACFVTDSILSTSANATFISQPASDPACPGWKLRRSRGRSASASSRASPSAPSTSGRRSRRS